MAISPYPLGFPSESVQKLIDLLMRGNLLEKKDATALYVWNIQGYAMGTLFGYPETHMTRIVPPADAGTCKAVSVSRDLHQLVELLEKQSEQPRAAVLGFDIWMLIDLLMKLLEIIRERGQAE